MRVRRIARHAAGGVYLAVLLCIALSGTARAEEASSTTRPASAETLEFAHLVVRSDRAGEIDAFDAIVAQAVADSLSSRNRAVVTDRDVVSSDTTLLWEYSVLTLLPRLHVSLSVYDRNRELLIVSGTGRSAANLALYDSIDRMVEDVIGSVDRYVASIDRVESEIGVIPLGEPLTTTAFVEDGRVLVVQPVAPLSLPAQRRLLTNLDETLPARVEREGFYGRDIVLNPEAVPPTLTQKRRLGLQFHYSFPRMAGAGFGVRYYPVADRLSTAFETDLYFSAAGSGSPYSVLHAEGRLLAGVTFPRDPEQRLRFGLSSGPGMIATIFFQSAAPSYIDLYWNVFNLALEFHMDRQVFFVRSGLLYAFDTDRGFLAGGVETENANPQIFVGTVRMW